MSPPWARGPHGPRRGPPLFILQILRIPLTINNLIALAITSQLPSLPTTTTNSKHALCSLLSTSNLFAILFYLFAASLIHNFLAFGRFHRIRKSIFSESVCSFRRRMRQNRAEGIEMSDEEKSAMRAKFGLMMKKMPSLFVSMADFFLGLAFVGVFVWSTLVLRKTEGLTLGMAYANVGALTAAFINVVIGLNGMRMYVRVKRQERREAMQTVEENEKEGLLEN